jgi:hypothetical protein
MLPRSGYRIRRARTNTATGYATASNRTSVSGIRALWPGHANIVLKRSGGDHVCRCVCRRRHDGQPMSFRKLHSTRRAGDRQLR